LFVTVFAPQPAHTHRFGMRQVGAVFLLSFNLSESLGAILNQH
jgi:hypothetical protein